MAEETDQSLCEHEYVFCKKRRKKEEEEEEEKKNINIYASALII